MNKTIYEELEKMIQLAIEKGLIPPINKGVEFTVDGTGQASCVEFWNCSKRRDSDRTVVVAIPDEMQSEFVFSEAAKHVKKNIKI